jgi:hypothetical protein
MAALYDVKDTVKDKVVMKDRTALEIANKFGVLPGNIRRYSDLKYLLRKRYLIVNTYRESRTEFVNFKERWNEARFKLNPDAKPDKPEKPVEAREKVR